MRGVLAEPLFLWIFGNEGPLCVGGDVVRGEVFWLFERERGGVMLRDFADRAERAPLRWLVLLLTIASKLDVLLPRKMQTWNLITIY